MRTDAILQFMRKRRRDMLATLRDLVEHESPSSDKAAVDCCLDVVARRAEALGGRTRRHRAAEFGAPLEAEFSFQEGGRGAGRLLVLGHADTVWELGTLRRMPFRVKDGKLYGPGVFDMKSGLTCVLYAIRAIRELKLPVRKQITLLVVSDEEVGSNCSRPITERLARGCDAVLVPEPPSGPQGALKTARKGVGEYRVTVHGRAAHAGLDFASGASATAELARQLVRIARFTRLRKGITVNIGVIGGGTRSNVVAEQAWAEIDVRIPRLSHQQYIEKQFSGLRPVDTRTRLEITGGLNRPPMERSTAIAGLFRKARELARPLGVDLRESMVGGGSDGNFTAALGIPTLDGLGVTGHGAHAADEHIVLEQLPVRAALLAHLLVSF